MTTIDMKQLLKYQNGNITVTLYDDGSKEREYNGVPIAEFPESVDLKITNFCNLNCIYCHESSTIKGKHAEISTLFSIIDTLHAGTELAIGGGDPFSHPKITEILQYIASKGIYSNITVNARHIARYANLIHSLRQDKLLYGLGVSYHPTMNLSLIADSNTIVHFIAGVTHPYNVLKAMKSHDKILVLGYKQYGRGIVNYSKEVEDMLDCWRFWIPKIMRSGQVCFDNLALEQLNIQSLLLSETWNRCYMGRDGAHTFYIDAVSDSYAKSSTCERTPRHNMNSNEMLIQINS